jgi:FAD/FMN-containing dehydrogenase
MQSRRAFLRTLAAVPALGPLAAFGPAGCSLSKARARSHRLLLNDAQTGLNATRVRELHRPASLPSLQDTLRRAARLDAPVSISGARHAMGGQQFAPDAVQIDTTALDRVLSLDPERGLIEAEAGIMWPDLIAACLDAQAGRERQWGIFQKQSGAPGFTLGGSLAANIHGRPLSHPPFVADIEAFTLLDARGEPRRCSRAENPDLFALAIGGYGLFGPVYSVQLRLCPRVKLRRHVRIAGIDGAADLLDAAARDGRVYGDFQFSVDHESPGFLRQGVLSTYAPADPATPIPPGQQTLTTALWLELVRLARADKARAFTAYADHYLATDGQVYWSDTHQLGTYVPGYAGLIAPSLPPEHRGVEVITELYVPPEDLPAFMSDAAASLRRTGAPVTYGTVRLIEPDTETFLPWARRRYACIILNLFTPTTVPGRERTARAFGALIDLAVRRGGSYYLTYHRHATRDQVLACYPQLPEFLLLKRRHDPNERFRSAWYNHTAALLS